jgi:hypothetical protein
MSVSEPVDIADFQAPRPRMKKWKIAVVVVLLFAGLLVAVYTYVFFAARRDLNEALAQAARDDPGWRLADLESRRTPVPDERNGALQAMKARALMPAPLPGQISAEEADAAPTGAATQTLGEKLDELGPNEPLSPQQAARLRAELARAADALAEARKLADLPEGRFPITYTPDFVSTVVCAQQPREAAYLLKLDAFLRIHDGQSDEALLSARAAFNAGRSIGDEPVLISQLVRLNCRNMALACLERALAQGQPSEEALIEFQQVLLEEDSVPVLLIGARGERAGLHQLMEALESGQASVSLARRLAKGGSSKLPDRATDIVAEHSLVSVHAWILRWLNDFVDAAKLPPWERRKRLEELERRLKEEAPFLARELLPSQWKPAEADQRESARLRCALVALAAERYRKAKGEWPVKLADLEARELDQVPLDPYDGQPLRYGRLADGVAIYSLGPDGEDHGGAVGGAVRVPADTNYGFQLWDVDRRERRVP